MSSAPTSTPRGSRSGARKPRTASTDFGVSRARRGAQQHGSARRLSFMSTTAVDVHHDQHGRGGFLAWILRWITTTNHKDIGTLYLVFALFMFFVGGGMAMIIRAELFQPG